MEESVTSVDFLTYYKQCMKLEPVDVNMYSPLVLAYIGDAVYELIIRFRVVNQGSMQVNKMHKRSAGLVKAGTQAALIRAIEDLLTAEEHAATASRARVAAESCRCPERLAAWGSIWLVPSRRATAAAITFRAPSS